MKTTQLVLIPFLLYSFASYSQFNKGDKYLGGTISASTQRAPTIPGIYQNNVTNSISINSSLGFLLNEKIAVGGQIGYANYYYKNTSNPPYIIENKSPSYTIGVFAKRYYTISDKFLFTMTGFFNSTRISNIYTLTYLPTDTTTQQKTQTYQLSTSIRPSFLFFPSPKWGFEASVGSISYVLGKDLSTGKNTNTFNINYGTLSLGLSYYFRKASQTNKN